MKYICNSCNKGFNAKELTNCPICGSSDVESVIEKSIKSKIDKYNELVKEMEELIDKYTPLYLEASCINNTLRVYKQRGFITEEEIPKFKRHSLESKLAAYRKAKREAKKGD